MSSYLTSLKAVCAGAAVWVLLWLASGSNCARSRGRQGRDPCTSYPCGIDTTFGVCEVTNKGRNYKCECSLGITGEHCEVTDQCESKPCLNNSTCHDGVGNYTCKCPTYTTGITCETVLDGCGSIPCLWDSQCTWAEDMYTCTCPPWATGVHCETVKQTKKFKSLSKIYKGEPLIAVNSLTRSNKAQPNMQNLMDSDDESLSNIALLGIAAFNMAIVVFIMVAGCFTYRWYRRKVDKEVKNRREKEHQKKLMTTEYSLTTPTMSTSDLQSTKRTSDLSLRFEKGNNKKGDKFKESIQRWNMKDGQTLVPDKKELGEKLSLPDEKNIPNKRRKNKKLVKKRNDGGGIEEMKPSTIMHTLDTNDQYIDASFAKSSTTRVARSRSRRNKHREESSEMFADTRRSRARDDDEDETPDVSDARLSKRRVANGRSERRVRREESSPLNLRVKSSAHMFTNTSEPRREDENKTSD